MTDAHFTYIWNRRHELKVRTLMNRLYYQERRRIFENRENVVKAASLLFGTIAFANVASPDIIKICAAIITGASACSLIFSFGVKARDSAQRTSEWIALERSIDIRGETEFTEADLNQWTARAHDIEATEPAAHQGILDQCHNRACTALGTNTDHQTKWWMRYHLFSLVP
ncbi:hypothetical protein [Glaciimonas immobilis]|uniref:SMODS and SLOG-associating 2TM effector domain-containing protein n=1 Tax=Glaciimonas immobilis TaxID=728004 RepID=A0A840RPW1_9BURK|nr:hypothetical protein [Glaciimonas immobilis]KAF3999202.1 hypothetical protein HAV38_04500 [Glaciimonas immobilis]MBB5198660.1 hypothetical protein [Glaciimonas immobilis]